MEILIFLLLLILVLLPFLLAKGMRKSSLFADEAGKHLELKELENSLSHLLSEIETASERALGEADRATIRLELVIKRAEELIDNMAHVTREQKIEMKSPDKESLSINEIAKGLSLDEMVSLGLSSNQIAQVLGIGAGEVELILNLKANKRFDN
ncbi:MAG: hypothetical protein QMD53_03460 [Actinomycetota bacterium]|nr:hypothetical protein [Actinomycetota bacterium]